VSTSQSIQQPSTYLDTEQALLNIGSATVLRDMLLMLQELLTRDVPEIAGLMKRREFASAQHLLHSLKGCMPIFCRADLCEELASVEQMSKSAECATSEPAFAMLRPKLETLLLEITEYLARPVA
jgi:hypothetical protein